MTDKPSHAEVVTDTGQWEINAQAELNMQTEIDAALQAQRQARVSAGTPETSRITEPARGTAPAAPETARATAPAAPETAPAAAERVPTGPSPAELARQANEQTIKTRLDEARTMYLRMKKEDTEAHSFKAKFTGKSKDQMKILAALQQVENDYKKSFAEYKAINAEDAMFEKDRRAEEQARMLIGEREPGKLVKWYKKLGESSILGTKNYNGPFKKTVKFLTNNRTLLNAALIGAAVVSGPGGWIAGGALVSRRLISGFGAGLASRDLVKSARQKNIEGTGLPIYATLADSEEYLATMRARAGLDGTMDKLQENQNYQAALKMRRDKVKKEYEKMSPEQKMKYIEEALDLANDKLDEKIEHEKKWNRLALYAGIGAGVFVGSGTAAKMIRGIGQVMPDTGVSQWMHDHTQRLFGSLMGHHEAVAASTTGAAGGHATAVVESTHPHEAIHQTIIDVDSKGVEGDILRLKKSNPDQFKTVIAWLQSQDYNHGVKDPGALVDRWARHVASLHGATVDGGGHDLSRILGAQITIGEHGELDIGHEHYMSAAHTVTPDAHTAIADQAHEQANTQVSFKPFKPQFDFHPTAGGSLAGISPHEQLFDQHPADHIGADHTVDSHIPETTSPDSNIDHSADAHVDHGDDSIPTQAVESKPSIFEQTRLDDALAQTKSSKALKVLLEPENYKAFAKQLGLGDKNLDKIQNMTLGNFLHEYNTSESFHKTYSKLVGKISGIDNWLTPQDSNDKMKNIIFALGRAFKK